MDEERSFVYTLILGVCMLLCLLMIGRMLLGHPADQRDKGAGKSGSGAANRRRGGSPDENAAQRG